MLFLIFFVSINASFWLFALSLPSPCGNESLLKLFVFVPSQVSILFGSYRQKRWTEMLWGSVLQFFRVGPERAHKKPKVNKVALFVPTSSAALGIAFKASLMLCSHLHEQSGCTGVAIAMASPSEIWCKDITFLCTFQKTSQLFLPIFGSSERFCAIMHDTARWCTIAVEQARSVTHLSLLIGGSLQNCTGQNHCSKIGQVCKNPRL